MTRLLPRRSPHDAGSAAADARRLIDALESVGGVHGVVVVHEGAVVGEAHWAPYTAEQPHLLFSVSKSFTAAAVGFAVAEGLLDPDDRVVDLLTDDAPADPSPHLAAMRVRHLLTMTSGHASDTLSAAERGDGAHGWARRILALPVEHEPGTHFVYNTGATYLLSAIVHRLAGQRLLDYLTPRLFEPLGIAGAHWVQDPDGIDVGGYGLSLTTEQIAAFGQVLLDDGRRAGRQVLPAGWVAEATAAHVSNAPVDGSSAPVDWAQGYGFQFWRCRHGAYRADGAFGQFIVVWPDRRLVIAMTGGVPDMQRVLGAVWAAYGAGPGEAAAPASLVLPMPEGEPSSLAEADLLGVRFRLDANPLGLEALTVDRADGGLVVAFEDAHGIRRVPAGYREWMPAPAVAGAPPLAAAAAWTDPRTLLVRVADTSTPFIRDHRIEFDASGIHLTVDQNVAFGPTRLAEVHGAPARDADPTASIGG